VAVVYGAGRSTVTTEPPAPACCAVGSTASGSALRARRLGTNRAMIVLAGLHGVYEIDEEG